MKCHYEVLNVDREADGGEIKSAYRKLALKWHPDKNLNNIDEAKEQFQLVQQAYEVLSDPQERAWYDKHREQILRGSNSEYQDNSLDVFQYFTTTCFKGFNDDEKGFYTVYRTVFDKIIEEDMEFMEDKEEFCEIPRFGDSKSDYDEVVGPFYGYWMSYCTKKSYVWLDPYDIKETRDRRVVKLIEKENKKVRQKAKKERNEEVRNLVAFVRKRDRRVKEHTKLIEAKVKENRQKQEEIRKQKILERKQELLDQSQTQAEWAKFHNVEMELEEIEKNLDAQFGDKDSEDEEDEIDDNLYCVACNRVFKTQKSFANHESSKKHKENVEFLRDTLLEEEAEDDVSDSEENGLSEDEKHDEEELAENAELTNEDLSLSEEEVSVEETKKQKKKKKKGKNVMKVHEPLETEKEAIKLDVKNGDNSDSDFNFDSSKKQKKKAGKKNKKAGAEVEDKNQTESTSVDNNVIPNPTPSKVNKNKKSNKKQDLDNVEEIDTNLCCVTCKSNFPSKNKLFDHLKKTGHGVHIATKVKSKKSARERN